MAMAEGDKNISRRDALKWIGRRTAETAGFVGINALAFTFTSWQQADAQERAQLEANRAFEMNDPLQAKYFAKDILITADAVTDGKDDDTIVKIIAAGFTGNVVLAYAFDGFTDTTNKKVAAVAGVTARSVDLVSTLAFAKYFGDPRFEEYGLDSYMAEQNPLLGKHPSTTDVMIMGAITIPLMALVARSYPFIGRIYAGAVGFVAKHNYRGAHLLKSSLEIGDQVKGLIEEGADEDKIKTYLNMIQQEAIEASEQTRTTSSSGEGHIQEPSTVAL